MDRNFLAVIQFSNFEGIVRRLSQYLSGCNLVLIPFVYYNVSDCLAYMFACCLHNCRAGQICQQQINGFFYLLILICNTIMVIIDLREWVHGLFLLYICSSALFVIPTVSTDNNSLCGVYSSLDTDDFWESVGRCIPCIQSTGCGFCQSTLQCLDGTLNGPSNGFPCPTWMYSMYSLASLRNI